MLQVCCIASEWSVQGSQPKPTRTQLSGYSQMKISNRAYSVDPTENDWKHTIWFQARDRLQVGLQNDHCPQLTLTNFMSDHTALVAKTITDAYYKHPQPKRSVFTKKWIDDGTFLQEVNGAICFHLMSNLIHNTRANPASETTSRTT
ncbi:uncharacterized protein UDID_18286 [Ustilago sp. UG-2017a]|nr:uncharacterized protein UDID_18286 [Ustilago sp. UG-2017a]